MKSLVVVGCLLFVVATVHADSAEEEAFMNLIHESLEACRKELNIEESEAAKFKNFDLEGDEKHQMGCLNACVMQKMGVMDGTTINIDNLKTNMLEKVVTDTSKMEENMKIIKDCHETVKDSTDECDMAFDFESCVMKKSS
ncbi:general odorant-binding protein 19d-like [Calliopsis andreniformis]|uniref:general odorant-binding protein 19d-like n=1 Tax=Calliopsis andreniformis TaxID=337506 RepID=UPI003FCE1CC5